MNLLALDLGTQLGWAHHIDEVTSFSHIDLSPTARYHCSTCGFVTGERLRNGGKCPTLGCPNKLSKHQEPWGQRYSKFKSFLESYTSLVDKVLYEEVLFNPMKGSAAPQMWGGYHAILLLWGIENKITIIGLGVSRLKKQFTGKGNASKDEVFKCCIAKGFQVQTYDEADAVALLSVTLEKDKHT